MMTEQQFRIQIQQAVDQYAAGKQENAGRLDQRLAEIFNKSEWTQDRIALELKNMGVGKSQQWVGQRLRFGRFLAFTTTCSNSQTDAPTPTIPLFLTEGKFRGFWNETTGTEQERFAEVAEKMNDMEVEKSLPVRKWLIETYGGRGWFTVANVLEDLGSRGVTEEKFRDCVRRINSHRVDIGRVGRRGRTGRTERWRIHQLPRKVLVPTNKVDACFANLESLVAEIKRVSSRHINEVSQTFILEQVVRIERVLGKFRDETINNPSRPTRRTSSTSQEDAAGGGVSERVSENA